MVGLKSHLCLPHSGIFDFFSRQNNRAIIKT